MKLRRQIGDQEDRGRFGLFEGDDQLAALHAGQLLDGAGDTGGDVELPADDVARWPDLPVVRRIADIDRSARGTYFREPAG